MYVCLPSLFPVHIFYLLKCFLLRLFLFNNQCLLLKGCLDILKFSLVFLFICLRKVTICEILVMLTQLKGDWYLQFGASLIALLYFHINYLFCCGFQDLSLLFLCIKNSNNITFIDVCGEIIFPLHREISAVTLSTMEH